MPIPTEPIGSIPRPAELLATMREHAEGRISDAALRSAESSALRDTLARFERTGSPIISDGEQTKPSFATYPLVGLTNLAPDGVVIPFADGHARQLPRLNAGPFRFGIHAATYLRAAQGYTRLPVKQAVISASALSLLYPQEGIPGYLREAFIEDLIRETEVHQASAGKRELGSALRSRYGESGVRAACRRSSREPPIAPGASSTWGDACPDRLAAPLVR